MWGNVYHGDEISPTDEANEIKKKKTWEEIRQYAVHHMKPGR